MKSRILVALGLTLALALSGCGQDAGPDYARIECTPLPEHREKVARHGHHYWSDHRLRVSAATPSGVQIPVGWIAVGADRIDAGCAIFPPKQATLFVNPEFWNSEMMHSDAADLDLNLVYLKTTTPDDLESWKRMVTETYRDVSTLFPLGLLPDEKRVHSILVTAGIAGDGSKRSTRLFPAPGPNLSDLFYNLESSRGRSLFIHTAAHLFNKRRPRAETHPVEDGLPRTEYRELVATWAELAFNPNSAFIKERVAFLKRQHILLTDGDPGSWPSVDSIEKIRNVQGPYGLPPNAPERSEAAREYAHYYLSPLIMLAVEGLLEHEGSTISVHEILREIHTGDSPGLLSSLRRHLPKHFEQIRAWMDGTQQIPAELIDSGLVRTRSGART